MNANRLRDYAREHMPEAIIAENEEPFIRDGKLWVHMFVPHAAMEGYYTGVWRCLPAPAMDNRGESVPDALESAVRGWCDSHIGQLVPGADLISFLNPGADKKERAVMASRLWRLSKTIDSAYVRPSTLSRVQYGKTIHPLIWGRIER